MISGAQELEEVDMSFIDWYNAWVSEIQVAKRY